MPSSPVYGACDRHRHGMSQVDSQRPIDPELVARLTEREVELLTQRTPRSLELCRRAVNVMPLGVPNGVYSGDPYPIFMRSGRGADLEDVDGNRYVDYGGGFGTTVFGHAHPLILDALHTRASRGTHFGTVTEEVIPWAEEICGRFGLDWVRFSNSGTEATMDALRLARAHTGRQVIAKIEGGYHGSHPHALVSNNSVFADEHTGSDEDPVGYPAGLGVSATTVADTIVLPFNNLQAAERALSGETVAALIVEPIMFNVGTVWPEPGYLAGLRELCDTYGTLLIFDEVKSGATVAYGGAEDLFGVKPHVKCLAKGIGGGAPVGAFGDTDGRLFSLIESWDVPHLGTFSGNPMTAAMGLAALTDVLTPASYVGLQQHGDALASDLRAVIATYDLPAYVTNAGAKGCVVWAAGAPLRDFRDYQRRFDFAVGELAWFYMVNRGVWLTPGQDEQWTHSVAHGDAERRLFVDVFEQLARELRPPG